MTLYSKELLRTIKSFIFLIVAAGIIIFAVSQDVIPPYSRAEKPQPGESYGMTKSDDPKLIMPEAAESLFQQFSANEFVAYPNGYYKVVKLSQSEKKQMQAIINQLGKISTANSSANNDNSISSDSTEGISSDLSLQIEGDSSLILDNGGIQINSSKNNQISNFQFDTSVTWEHFSELMLQADKLLGGGSDFSPMWMSLKFGLIPITYQQALDDYNLIVSSDKITGAHARLFSDYMGIIMGLLPVFMVVFIMIRDRKTIVPMIYTRSISSYKFIFSRFFAYLTASMIPILIMSVILTAIHINDYGFRNIDLLAYLKYSLFWIMPTAMASTAIGMFITVLTNTPLAIAVQFFWWFYGTMTQTTNQGSYNFLGVNNIFTLIPRHNSFGDTQAFIDYLPSLVQNRICISLISIALVLLSAIIFNIRRRGMLNVTIFNHSKIQSKN